jgi:hypothetical protein
LQTRVRGRPSNPRTEICPKHKTLGYTRFKTTWNGDYPGSKRRRYRYFVHKDPKIGDHPIPVDKYERYKRVKSNTIQVLREYNRLKGKEVTTFLYNQEKRLLIQAKPNYALPIIVCELREEEIPDFSGICRRCNGRCNRLHDLRCSICNNTTVVFCPKCQCHYDFSRQVHPVTVPRGKVSERKLRELRKNSLKLEEIEWLLKDTTIQAQGKDNKENNSEIRQQKKICEYLNGLHQQLLKNFETQPPSYKIIIAFGKDAVALIKELSRFKSFQKIEERKDSYGVIAKIEERRKHRENLSIAA